MDPLVSILIPAYNADRWISETIESALAQTWPKKEIIIVDDGSTDLTLKVANQFARSNVLVVTQGNLGASAARNRAYELSQGDYVQWLDADDLIAPDKVEAQLHASNHSASDTTLYSASWGRFYYDYCRAAFLPDELWQDSNPVEWSIMRLQKHLSMVPVCWLTSRKLAEQAGPWNEDISFDDDGEYFNRVVLASEKLRFVKEARCYYRLSGSSSLSRSYRSNRRLESLLLSHKLQWNQLREVEDSDRVRHAFVRYLQFFFICYYPDRPDLVREMQDFAKELGGELSLPAFPPKYAWIGRVSHNWSLAKRAMFAVPALRESIERCFERYRWLAAGQTQRRFSALPR